MSAYQNFLDFFSMHNKERLDGLSESYFTEMTPGEREMAFDFLLKRVEKGGTEESVNGIFRADPKRAAESISNLLDGGGLSGEAQIAAARNLHKMKSHGDVMSVFIGFMSSSDKRLRAKAAYCVPSDNFNDELKFVLQGMIRTETEQLARIHAVDKLLECYGVSEDSVGRELYLQLYRGLHNEDMRIKNLAFKQLDDLVR